MCGCYGFVPDKKTFDRFSISNRDVQLSARFNGRPWDMKPPKPMPAVVQHSPNSIELMRWGFFRPWATRSIANATAEKVDSSPVFKKAFHERRCLVPAKYFIEWKPTPRGKVPYLIRLKTFELFAFAGLYEMHTDENGEEAPYFSIITTVANELVKPIHPKNRMPVILYPDDEETWLNPDNTETEQLLKLLKPYPASEMDAYPVSTKINNPWNDSEELIKPASEE